MEPTYFTKNNERDNIFLADWLYVGSFRPKDK